MGEFNLDELPPVEESTMGDIYKKMPEMAANAAEANRLFDKYGYDFRDGQIFDPDGNLLADVSGMQMMRRLKAREESDQG